MADRDLATVGKAGFHPDIGLAIVDVNVPSTFPQVPCRGNAHYTGSQNSSTHTVFS